MKKQILTACVAALSWSQFACDPIPSTSSPRQVQVKESLAQPVKLDVAPAPGPARDAGFEPEPVLAEVDPLSLPHDEVGNVDHLARAAELRELGDLEGALLEARHALYDAPDDLEVLTAIDRLSRLGGEPRLRVLALEKLARLKPEDAAPLIQLSRALLSLKDCDGALRAGLEAAQRDGSDPEAFQVLGRAHLGLGELSQAIASFEKVIALQPDHGHALNNLGFAYLRANRNQEALEVLERAVDALPEVAWVHNNLGVALERLGRLDEAKAEYAHSSDLSPKYLKARLNAARMASLENTAEPEQ